VSKRESKKRFKDTGKTAHFTVEDVIENVSVGRSAHGVIIQPQRRKAVEAAGIFPIFHGQRPIRRVWVSEQSCGVYYVADRKINMAFLPISDC
jgi:hypothetical protein